MKYEGLSTAEADQKRAAYGANEIPEKKQGFFVKIVKWLFSPIALMLLAAALLSLWGGKTFDFWFILSLMTLNFFVGFLQEKKADTAIQKLKKSLAREAKVLRDGKWEWIDSRFIVPGDIVQLMVGDIVPADGTLLEAQNLTINEAVLTGESLPKEKNIKDTVYSDSFVATGSAVVRVTATGIKTYFGKTVTLVEKISRRSILEKDILTISKFLMIISIVGVLLITAIFLTEHAALGDVLILDLSLIIAGIPISLPTVMTLIISLGALELAKKHVIVRRLSSLEDLANVNLLLTDKTGTLTENKITVTKIFSYGTYTPAEVLHYAIAATPEDTRSAIDKAVNREAEKLGIVRDFSVMELTPADSERKHATALALFPNNVKILISVGAAQTVASFCAMDSTLRSRYATDVQHAADQGYRVLGIAIREDGTAETGMKMIGILTLSDPLDIDAKEIIDFLKENEISVKMLTGDNIAISTRTAGELGLSGSVITRDQVDWNSTDKNYFDRIGTFAQILPEDKFKIANLAQANQYIIAMTGDGVNDLAAVKEANVGIAVKNAVDALKSAADIVLLSPGISVIRDALVEARKIFSRLYSYSIYRISESFRLIVTVVVLGLVYRTYPLTPVQLILIALLNDIPIISLAFNRVKHFNRPSKIRITERFVLGSLYGVAGVFNSLILFFLMMDVFHLDWNTIQTVFFLKLMVSGHMLIYVAHTKERWYKFLPSSQVIIATTATQLAASAMAFFGIFMSGIPLLYVVGVWVWSFAWMQVTEMVKIMDQKFIAPNSRNESPTPSCEV